MGNKKDKSLLASENVPPSGASGRASDWYVEYTRESTRLARLLKSSYRRGLVHHIGESGLQFRAPERLEEGKTIYLKLHLKDVSCPLRAKAQVRWVREEPWSGIENYTHVVGAVFVDCPTETVSALRKLGH